MTWRNWWREHAADADAGLCMGCLLGDHCDGREPVCDCLCTQPEDTRARVRELAP